MDDLRARFEAALALEHETERKLAVVSIIDQLVQRIGFRAIVIGGLAVEFWTRGAYATHDIDLYLPHGPAVDDLLAERLRDALIELERLSQRLRRGEKFESYELHEIARALRRPGVH